MPTCPNGHTVAPGNAFCHHCGATIAGDQTIVRPAPLADDTAERAAIPAVAGETVVQPQPPTYAPPFNPGPPTMPPPVAMGGYEPPQERRNNNAVIYWVAGLVILLAIGGVTAALLLNSGGSNNDSQSKNPITNPTIATSPTPSMTPTTSGPSQTAQAPMPAGGSLCAGLILGKYQFGTIGTNTSCGFVRAVYKAWESSGNQSPVTATSPATHETYSNIVCTVDSTRSWATCVGGRNNSAQMFFALP